MRTFTLLALVTALTLPLAACGDDDESDSGGSASGDTATQEDSGGAYSGKTGNGSSGGGKAQTLKISADPGGALAWDKSTLSAKAGEVTIVMDNPSDLPHAVEIEGDGVEVAGETVMKGGVSKASADLKAGEYEYYCPVGNHRDAGMTGTLTVN
jgi:plastocyanin